MSEFIYLFANAEQFRIFFFFFPGQGLNLNTQVKEQLPYLLKSAARSRLISQGRCFNNTVSSAGPPAPINQRCPVLPHRRGVLSPSQAQGHRTDNRPPAALLPAKVVTAGLAVSAAPMFWRGWEAGLQSLSQVREWPRFSPGSNPTCELLPSDKATRFGGPRAAPKRRGWDRMGVCPQCPGWVLTGGWLCWGRSGNEATPGMAEASDVPWQRSWGGEGCYGAEGGRQVDGCPCWEGPGKQSPSAGGGTWAWWLNFL